MRNGRSTLLTAALFLTVSAGCTSSDSGGTSSSSSPAEESAAQTTSTLVEILSRSATLDLVVGDCYTNISSPHPVPTVPIDAASGDRTTTVPLRTTTTLAVPPAVLLVSCDSGHDGQVYAKFCLGSAVPLATTTTADTTTTTLEEGAGDDPEDDSATTTDGSGAASVLTRPGDPPVAGEASDGEATEAASDSATTTVGAPPTSLRPGDLNSEVCPGNPSVPWPGDRTIRRAAARSCVEEFEFLFDVDYSESPRRSMEFVPNEALWAQGDRRVVCSVDPLEPATTTTSANGG